jgi:DNA polymerase III alpha subunit
MTSGYVELRARSAFSFLEGATTPEDLVLRAAELGYGAIALSDRDGLYGAPRFHQAATNVGIKPMVGAELTLDDDARLYVLVPDRSRYRNLCRMITDSKLRAAILLAEGVIQQVDDVMAIRARRFAELSIDGALPPTHDFH